MSTWSEPKRYLEPPASRGFAGVLPRWPQRRYRYTRTRWHAVMAVIDLVGGLVFSVVRRLGGWLGLKPAPPVLVPRSILLVQLDHLGDAVLSSMLPRLLREHYPQAVIEVLASESCAELFRGIREVDRVWVCHRNRLARTGQKGWIPALVGWGLKLRKRRYDLAIDVRGELPIALLMWLTGAPRRLGWQAGGGGFMLTDSADYVPGRHEVRSRLALLAALEIMADAEMAGPRYSPPRAAADRMAQRVARIVLPGEDLFVLHVGAGMPAKQWPVSYWRELSRHLRTQYRARIILVGTAGERQFAQRMTRLDEHPRVVDWTGQTDIGELAALLEMADLFVGADSGPAHLAAAAGAPSVVLFSGTNQAEQWRPWGDQVRVVQRYVACSPCHLEVCPVSGHPCMSDLRPALVFEAIEATLRQHRRRPQRYALAG